MYLSAPLLTLIVPTVPNFNTDEKVRIFIKEVVCI